MSVFWDLTNGMLSIKEVRNLSLRIITGRAGSGKSRFLMRLISELVTNPLEKIIVIVPGQLTFETEKRIMHACGVEGILGLEVLSIQRLAYKILEETGSVPFMTGAEKTMACRLALQAYDAPFCGTGHLPDFENSLGALFTQLKSHGQTPESLRGAARSMTDKGLISKLLQTADIYQKYMEICGSRLDMADMYAAAASRAAGASFLRGAHVFIDGADSYVPSVTSMLAEVMAQTKNTLAVFRTEGSGSDAALFTSEKRDMERLMSAAKARGIEVQITEHTEMAKRHTSEALAFLEKNLFCYPYSPYTDETDSLKIFEAESPEQEIQALASCIRHHVRGGKRFRDIAVAAGGLETYLPIIKSVFSSFGIPCFIDERRALSENAFFVFLYSALCAATGETAAAEGYVFSEYAPLDVTERSLLKNYARQYGYKGWHFFGEFRRGAAATQAEALRRQVMQPLLALESGLLLSSAGAQTDAVRQFLADCGVREKIQSLCDVLVTEDVQSECAYFAQVYEKSLEVLSAAQRIGKGRQLSAKLLCSLIKAGFEATKIALIPPAADEVRIFDISVGRLPDIDILFAIGVHDGVWPARDSGTGILSAAEQDALRGLGLDLGGYDLAEEKMKVYTALTQPKERLYISYNAQTGQPSVVADRIQRLFPLIKKTKVPAAAATGLFEDVLGELAQVLRGKEADADLAGICAHFLADPQWRKQTRAILLRTNAALTLPEDTARRLCGFMRCSPTRIENFYRCPFKHFIDYGIKAQVLRDYEYDRLDIGTYLHLALDIFTQSLITEKKDLKELSAEQTQCRMQAAAHLAAQQHDDGKLLTDERFALIHKQLVRELADTAHRIRVHFLGSEASLHASEVAFEYVVDAQGCSTVITGKIDRIDTAGGYFRVVDYKSSAARFDPDAFAAGTALQLPVYIDAARRLPAQQGLLPAGGYYMRIGEKFHDSAVKAQREGRMNGLSLADTKVLCAFSSVQEGGSFSAIDQSLKKSGELHGRGAARFFTANELDALLCTAQRMIASAAVQIYSGVTDINPAGSEACKMCDYAGICQINTEYEGNAYRVPERFDKAQLRREGA